MVTIGDCSCGKRCRAGSTKCSSCETLDRKAARIEESDNAAPINKMSAKTSSVNTRYFAKIRTWKRGKKCEAHFKHDCSGDVTVHHMAGRGNHPYDEYAEEKGIPLTLDDRFWKPLCTVAHNYITENSKFAWENGYSFKRITDPIFIKK
jgi:hypothetical protein